MIMASRTVRAWLCLSVAGVAACAQPVGVRTASRQAARDTSAQQGGFAEAAVLAFARRHLGQQVGNGECAELADRALTSFGAATASDFTATTTGEDYVWGQRVPLEQARPGDIVQLLDYHAIVTTRSHAGTVVSEDYTPNHTAIVEENLGNALAILQQNADPLGKTVQRALLPTRSGSFAGAPSGAAQNADASTTVAVVGVVSVYRPVMKTNFPLLLPR